MFGLRPTVTELRTIPGMTSTLRPGQKAFNELYAQDPAIADQIRCTDADPFYDDRRLDAFRKRVAELRAAHP
jgi:hypothetical protein